MISGKVVKKNSNDIHVTLSLLEGLDQFIFKVGFAYQFNLLVVIFFPWMEDNGPKLSVQKASSSFELYKLKK